MKLSSIASMAVIAMHQTYETSATFTIAAADSSKGQVGASGASCVAAPLIPSAYHSVPGHGVCITQGRPPNSGSPVYGDINGLLAKDVAPTEIIKAITDPTFDTEQHTYGGVLYDGVTLRQYGCVDLQGRADAYTGQNLTDVHANHAANVQEHSHGTVGTIAYSAQGNVVANNTVSKLKDTFVADTGACDLAERLYNSLAAVYEAQPLLGDVRCFGTITNAAGSTTFIRVENADGTTAISIDEDSPTNPWPNLKLKYQTWRSSNPCPNITAAPSLSPVIPSFEKVGDGICVDASNNKYSVVWELGTAITSAEDCGRWCLQHPEPNFVGFTSPKSTTHGCICHFSGALVTPRKNYANPKGYHEDFNTGFGVISGVTNFTALPTNPSNPVDVSNRECFRYKV